MAHPPCLCLFQWRKLFWNDSSSRHSVAMSMPPVFFRLLSQPRYACFCGKSLVITAVAFTIFPITLSLSFDSCYIFTICRRIVLHPNFQLGEHSGAVVPPPARVWLDAHLHSGLATFSRSRSGAHLVSNQRAKARF
jgi:hypothetical protein